MGTLTLPNDVFMGILQIALHGDNIPIFHIRFASNDEASTSARIAVALSCFCRSAISNLSISDDLKPS